MDLSTRITGRYIRLRGGDGDDMGSSFARLLPPNLMMYWGYTNGWVKTEHVQAGHVSVAKERRQWYVNPHPDGPSSHPRPSSVGKGGGGSTKKRWTGHRKSFNCSRWVHLKALRPLFQLSQYWGYERSSRSKFDIFGKSPELPSNLRAIPAWRKLKKRSIPVEQILNMIRISLTWHQ